VYEGAPCFVDHKDDENGRSLHDMMGTWRNVHYDSKSQRVRGDLHTMEQHRKLVFDVVKNAPDKAAPSHVVQAVTKRAKDENGNAFEDITHIAKCHSVDIVVGAATIDNIMEGLTMPDWKDITLEDLKKSRLDLLVEHEKSITSNDNPPAPEDDSYKRLYEAEVKKREEAEAETEKIKKEQEAAKKSADSEAHLDAALAESPLNEETKKALKERLDGVTLDADQAKKLVADHVKLIETATGKELKKESKVRLPKDSKDDGNKDKSDRTLLTEALCKSAGIEVDEKKQDSK